MAETNKIKYPIDATIIAKAAACKKGMTCLEHGPACRVGAVLNKDILIVDCKAKDSTCPFYKVENDPKGTDSHGPCTCPVRISLREKYDL